MTQLLLSVRPEHLVHILNGDKTLELRKSVPKDFVGWTYLYATKNNDNLIYNGRENEDVGFNRLFRLLKGKNRIPSLNQVVYAWHYEEGSIVRSKGHEYEFAGSIEGAVTNTIESVKHAIEYDFAKKMI